MQRSELLCFSVVWATPSELDYWYWCFEIYVLFYTSLQTTDYTMSSAKQIYIAIVGVGGVGKAFLGQLQHLTQRLQQQSTPITLSLVLVRRSTKQLFSSDFTPLDPTTVLSDLEKPPPTASHLSRRPSPPCPKRSASPCPCSFSCTWYALNALLCEFRSPYCDGAASGALGCASACIAALTSGICDMLFFPSLPAI